ncbi:5-methyltetrahydropteroyltriglutamate--homocysteine S-methyltransferase [Gallaecimonas xiamenensis]|uniref:5-methyltetrahydropteroyltriglutamate--homocysteine methyltransferase n=1 Tax=Gallaecimonas xiamenensis 3-C-1 TaxID=745411 RepID=K2JP78_9GAMM|nr:5-methyltetrahydropteroyltriglutamate--homocysteine S-methyltransferase [Gallaecimonas xiamenensis]EKE77053.1 5-methyltetrahydropteroyltriglutamate--homocysteine S-methyltransferase [Gallaecimonas xiamenensis 3-C-1]
MALTHSLGFPRVGRRRELKFALEAYWSGDSSEALLQQAAAQVRQYNWQVQQGLDFVPAGDFTLYDHVLDTAVRLGAVPERFKADEPAITTYFRQARGRAPGGQDVPALEMTKWFNTNYHYLVPELADDQQFSLNVDEQLAQIREARAAGHKVKPVLVGPVTFLYLSKQREGADQRLSHLPKLINAYSQWLDKLAAEGIEWVQIDEPLLVTDISSDWQQALQTAYQALSEAPVKILLASYFGTLGNNLALATSLPVAGLHIDAVAGRAQLGVVDKAWPEDKVLSVGIVNGRNVWRTDLRAAIDSLKAIGERRGNQLWVAPSCSLLHSPVDLAQEDQLDDELKSWLAFGVQKVEEVQLIAKALNEGEGAIGEALAASDAAAAARKSSKRIHSDTVAKRVAAITGNDSQRQSAFGDRIAKQREYLKLPAYPTTTIGSFPQTPTIRGLRRDWRAGRLSEPQYREAISKEIEAVIREQEALDLDVLVHGEAERNDMVEYFGELLDGFAFTRFGWVQSYGSRCVKPPIIFGDVSRAQAMTVEWAAFAQTLTDKPVKGMLTGPVTILGWSFPRDDIELKTIAQQIALALRDEVVDLEQAGIKVIQIDEPAFRELLPLKLADQSAYFDWAVEAFRLSAAGVADDTQIHTHMCYSEFNAIIDAIAALDADVITIETSRSANELLDVFREYAYPNEIGPGVYDIHSPRIPSVDEMAALIQRAEAYIPAERIWVNPDCGLKTRRWDEVRPALKNMVDAAKQLRSQVA